MDVYIYRAALYCGDCGEAICHELDKTCGPSDDSDDYPQGPYSDGGGEADFPQNCDGCGLFLENPLTSDGEDYVRDLARDLAEKHAEGALSEWLNYYPEIWER